MFRTGLCIVIRRWFGAVVASVHKGADHAGFAQHRRRVDVMVVLMVVLAHVSCDGESVFCVQVVTWQQLSDFLTTWQHQMPCRRLARRCEGTRDPHANDQGRCGRLQRLTPNRSRIRWMALSWSETSERLAPPEATLYRDVVIKLAYVAQNRVDLSDAVKCLAHEGSAQWTQGGTRKHVEVAASISRYVVVRACGLRLGPRKSTTENPGQTRGALAQAQIASAVARRAIERRS